MKTQLNGCKYSKVNRKTKRVFHVRLNLPSVLFTAIILLFIRQLTVTGPEALWRQGNVAVLGNKTVTLLERLNICGISAK